MEKNWKYNSHTNILTLRMENLHSDFGLVFPMRASSVAAPVASIANASPVKQRKTYKRTKDGGTPASPVKQRKKYERTKEKSPPGFLIRLRAMLNDNTLEHIVRWRPEGNGVIVLDVSLFGRALFFFFATNRCFCCVCRRKRL